MDYPRLEPVDQISRARAFHEECGRRRSVREFSADPLPAGLLYVRESVGLVVGLLLAAIHRADLVTLTHTRSPMGFLGRIPAAAQERAPVSPAAGGLPDRRKPCFRAASERPISY